MQQFPTAASATSAAPVPLQDAITAVLVTNRLKLDGMAPSFNKRALEAAVEGVASLYSPEGEDRTVIENPIAALAVQATTLLGELLAHLDEEERLAMTRLVASQLLQVIYGASEPSPDSRRCLTEGLRL